MQPMRSSGRLTHGRTKSVLGGRFENGINYEPPSRAEDGRGMMELATELAELCAAKDGTIRELQAKLAAAEAQFLDARKAAWYLWETFGPDEWAAQAFPWLAMDEEEAK